MKFRVTAYEPRSEGSYPRIAKHEVTMTTTAADGTVLTKRTSKKQMRDTVEGAEAAVTLIRKYRKQGYGVDIRDAQGRALDDVEFTALFDAVEAA